MEYSVIVWKAVVWGAVILVIDMIIGNLLYMNPVTAGIYKAYEGNPVMKTVDDFGGIGWYVGLNMGAGVFIVIVYLLLYLAVYSVLPENKIAAGLIFGAAIVLVKVLPKAFNQFMLFHYPVKLIVTQAVNSSISSMLFGLYTSGIYQITGTVVQR